MELMLVRLMFLSAIPEYKRTFPVKVTPRCQLSETSPSAELHAQENLKMAEAEFQKRHF